MQPKGGRKIIFDKCNVSVFDVVEKQPEQTASCLIGS